MTRRRRTASDGSPEAQQLAAEAWAAGVRTPEQMYDFLIGRMLRRYASGSMILRRLTVAQAARLLRSECWLVGTINLSRDLEPEDLEGSPLLREARMLLRHIGTGPGVELTATGRFTRAFSARMLDTLVWPGLDPDAIRAVCRVINETDVWPLHTLRLLLEVAELTRKYKGRLRLARGARRMLEPEAAGELFALLFRALFTRFDLAYLDRAALGGHLQRQAALTIYMIGREAGSWIAPAELQRRVVAPDEEMLHAPERLPAYVFQTRILRPLTWFGLLEERMASSDTRDGRQVRKTALFDRFLAFALPQGGPDA